MQVVTLDVGLVGEQRRGVRNQRREPIGELIRDPREVFGVAGHLDLFEDREAFAGDCVVVPLDRSELGLRFDQADLERTALFIDAMTVFE